MPSILDPSHLGGRFAVLDVIEQRGARTLARAYDSTLRREVLLIDWRTKTLEPQVVARIVHHAQSIAALSHPNVLALYDVVSDAEHTMLAMEHVRGTTLRAWQAERRRGPSELLAVYREVARGLSAAHRSGVVHGHFDADRVLISDEGLVKVKDLGLRDVEARAGVTVGASLSHPWQNEEPDPSNDQFAFCAALWEALVGRAPDVGDGQALAWPRRVPMASRVRGALLRGLASRPSDRFPSMDALLAALEPAPRRWRHLVLAVPVLACAGIAFGTSYAESAERCAGGRARMDATWNERREAVRDAMMATGVFYAPSTWTLVERQLDRYADEWALGHSAACEATAVTGEQPLEILDLRMACLRRDEVALGAAVELLARADAQVVEQAVAIVEQLPRVDRCSDIEALQADVPPPEDPADAAVVERAEQHLAEARVLSNAGKFAESLEQVERAEMLLHEVEYRPPLAEIALRRGEAVRHLGRYDEALLLLEDAVTLAFSASADDIIARSVSSLSDLLRQKAAFSESERLIEIAEGVAERCDCLEFRANLRRARGAIALETGRYPAAEQLVRESIAMLMTDPESHRLSIALAHTVLGQALNMQRRHDEAITEHHRSAAMWEAAFGPDHPYVTSALHNAAVVYSAAGRLVEAEREFRRVLARDQRELGPEHHYVGILRYNLGNVLRKQERHEEAVVELRASLEIRERALGADHPEVAMNLDAIGVILGEQGLLTEAEHELRRSLAIRQRRLQPDNPFVASTMGKLAGVLAKQRRFREAAEYYRDALARIEHILPGDHAMKRELSARLAEVLETAKTGARAAM